MTTLVYKYAGTDLSTLGVNAEVLEGAEGSPPVRGKNLLIPYQQGQRWVQKYYDERSVVVSGLMIPTGAGSFMYSTDALRQLFTIGAGEQKLEVSRPDGTTRYIMAEVRNTLGLARAVKDGFPQAAKFSIEMVASDPFWYGSLYENQSGRTGWFFDSGIGFDDGIHWFDTSSQYFIQTLTSSPVNVEASNAGTYYNRKPVLTLKGAMVNPKFLNLRNNYSIQINLTTTGVDTLVIDCGAQSVTKNGQPQSLGSVALGSGQTDWMRLEAGENTLAVALGVATPSVIYQAQYSPIYL